MVQEGTNNTVISFAQSPVTPRQRRFALVAVFVQLTVLALIAPLATKPLLRIDSFVPLLSIAIFATDFITSALLFAQYSVMRSSAVLVLASGYLFTALIVVSYALTFPEVFSPVHIPDADFQSAAYLYNFWHGGFPIALLAYVWLRGKDGAKTLAKTRASYVICYCVLLVFGLVFGLTELATTGDKYLPVFFLDATHATPLSRHVLQAVFLLPATAAVVLWSRQRSLLDQWLAVVALGLTIELVFVAFLSSGRFSVGFYAGRLFSLFTSAIVLIVFIWEITRLYANLGLANARLERERSNRLMNVEAATAAIAHELNQPLSAIVLNAETSLDLLERSPPNLFEVKEALRDIVADGNRTSDALNSIRGLYRTIDEGRQLVDVNEIALGVLHALRGELNSCGITTQTELAPEIPLIDGSRAQLQQVIFNLVHNAVEAMGDTKIRLLRLITRRQDSDSIVVAVQDTGSGIVVDQLDRVFDAFVTTKSHGTGLGLTICRVIIERHGGQVSAYSDGKSGAMFQFVLPIRPGVKRNPRA
jgi:signal transduction histidine kinase